MKSHPCSRRTTVLLGLAISSIATAQTHLYEIPGQSSGIRLGTCVAPAGDLDGDGVPDFLVGSHPAGASVFGFVQVFSGRRSALLKTLQSDTPDDGFGASAACLGDVDGDGIADFVVGAPQHPFPHMGPVGQIYVLSGRSGSILYTIPGGTLGWGIGRSIAAIGDVDQDGVADFAEGATFVAGQGTTYGSARVFSGRNGALIYTFTFPPGLGGIGSTVAGPGDVDGDGNPDILVGEPFHVANGSIVGAAFLYSGRDGSLIRSFRSHAANSRFGSAVAGAGDIDGDGHPDLIIGASTESTHGDVAGSVSVYSGADGSLLRVLYGYPGDRLGGFLSGGGDVNGDGYPDFAVGATGASVGGHQGGAVRVFSGRDGSVLADIPAQAPFEGVGPCAMLGDLNGDGSDDIAVGAPAASDGGAESGSARVYLLGQVPPIPYCWWKWNSQNCGSTPFTEGAASLSVGDGVLVRAPGILNHRPGFMLWGLSRAHIPFGGGTLCLQALDHGRVEDSGGTSNSGVDCTGSLAFRFTSGYMTSHGLSAGTRVFCQFVSRDDGFAPPNNIGLSQGLTFTVLP